MRILSLLLLLVSTCCLAQEQRIVDVARTVSVEDLKKHLYYLASPEMEGRVMGSRGDTMASAYIAASFKKSGVAAPYQKGKSYYQAINVFRKEPATATFSISDRSYAQGEGWNYLVRGTESFSFSNLPVVFAGYGIENDRYNDFSNIDVRGKVVLLLAGQPRDTAGRYLLSGTNRPANVAAYQAVLKSKGAKAVLIYNSRFAEDQAAARRRVAPAEYKSPYAAGSQNLPVLTLSEETVNVLLAPVNTSIKALEQAITSTGRSSALEIKNTVSADVRINMVEERAPNVIGMIRGTDPAAGAIILSAHHDHVGKMGGQIYYGAVDNASGTVALMEMASLLQKAAKKGLRPKRTIIFASYTGEEKGLLGAYHFAANPLVPIEKTWAVMNIDMMGRVDTFYSGRRADSNYAYILVKDTLNRNLRTSLYNANEKLGKLKLDTYYEQPQFMQRRLTGSDQYPFYLKGVPFVRIDCGFSRDYHQPTDTPDKINYELLAEQIKLAFLTAWNMANP